MDLVGCGFVPAGPNNCGSPTLPTFEIYIRMRGGWAYLAAIIDDYSRKIVDWPVDSRMPTSVDADALRTAIGWQRSGIGDVVIHSDRGCQYASTGFRALALANGVISSVGHTSICYD